MRNTQKKESNYTNWTIEQHIEHIKTHPSFQLVFDQYESNNLDEFIEQYAKKKHEWYEKRAIYKEAYEEHHNYFLTKANDYIDMVLQKKLFNLQCLWRANKVKLPLVNSSYDFRHWGEHVRNCPFIPPITEKEFELLIRFLKKNPDYMIDNDMDEVDWQDYETFKTQTIAEENMENATNDDDDADDSLEKLPELYKYFDTCQDTAFLIHLPDLRSEKEEIYLDAWRLVKYGPPKVTEEVAKNEPTVVLPKMYFWDEDVLKKFMHEAEDEQTKELYKQSVVFYRHHADEEDEIASDINFLNDYNSEYIPIEANVRWQDAICLTVKKYKYEQVMAVLPNTFATYLRKFKGRSIEKIIEERVAAYRYPEEKYDFVKEMNGHILEGRTLMGEPANFDF